jgi:hypothetical protein
VLWVEIHQCPRFPTPWGLLDSCVMTPESFVIGGSIVALAFAARGNLGGG